MEVKIKEYIRKILELGADIQEGDSLIVYMPEEIPEIERIMHELKEEYKIANIVFVKINYEEIYRFLATEPTCEEIYEFIKEYQPIRPSSKIKIINCISTPETNPYYQKLNTELAQGFHRYQEIFNLKNRELHNQTERSPQVVAVCPTSSWAQILYGSEGEIERLWDLVTKTVPSHAEAKKIIEDLQARTKYLNELGIKSLRFQTNSGTDLQVSLAKPSKWINSFSFASNGGTALNFPSYEICTSPDMNSAKGKMVITRPSFLGKFVIEDAELGFSKGKVISCKSANVAWKEFIKKPKNRLQYLGEIALVPSNNPIAELSQIFNETQLDENVGCHIALGDSLIECVDEEKFKNTAPNQKDCFNSSFYHQDLTIGDSSTCVEVTSTRGGRSRVLINNGKWNF